MYLDRSPFGAQLWAKEMPESEVKMIVHEMTGTNPPLYLSTMDYSRKLYILLESEESALDIQAALTAAYKDLVEFKGGMSSEYKKAVEKMTANGFIIGGSA